MTSKHYDKAQRLSEQDDLLSQWRGYADDASGAAIGFHRGVLETACDMVASEAHEFFA